MIISRTISLVSVLTFLVFLGTGCRKRAELDYQNEQLQLTLGELRTTLKAIDLEMAALPNLGRYVQTQKTHVPELKNRIQTITSDSARLRAERDTVKQAVEALQAELDAYQAKFARH